MFPFTEHREGAAAVRRFAHDVDDEELVWHRDREDRRITVLSGEGWFFQMDDRLPVLMRPGDVFDIPKETWHRVIRRGTSSLEVSVEFNS